MSSESGQAGEDDQADLPPVNSNAKVRVEGGEVNIAEEEESDDDDEKTESQASDSDKTDSDDEEEEEEKEPPKKKKTSPKKKKQTSPKKTSPRKKKDEPASTPVRHRGKGKKGESMLEKAEYNITKPALVRLARRGGVKRISATVFPEVRSQILVFLQKVLTDAEIYMAHSHQKTVMPNHMIQALKRSGRTLYGYGSI